MTRAGSDGAVVVFGYGPLAVAALDALGRVNARIAALVVPGNRSGADVDLARAAAAWRNIRVLMQPRRERIAPFIEQLTGLAPDLLVVWSYSMILPPEVLAVPRHGAVNVHGGLLPEYRGGHVMQWAIINGEPETGVTLHYVDAGVDSGPIVAQRRFPIDPADDAVSVRRKLEENGTALLISTWRSLLDGTASGTPQDESRAKYWPMRTAADGAIDWHRSAAAINNLVRALVAPWPGAFTYLRAQELIVRSAAVLPVVAASPGSIVAVDDQTMTVSTGDGALRLIDIETGGAAITPRALGASVGMMLAGAPSGRIPAPTIS